MAPIKSFLTSKLFTSVTILIVIFLIAGWLIFGNNTALYQTDQAVFRDLTQIVSITGKVKAAESVDLAFETGGRLASIYVKTGQNVNQGKLIAQISSSSLYADIEQAEAEISDAKAGLAQSEAALTSEEARLAELKRGPRPETIKLKETALAKARQDFTNYLNDIPTTLNNAYINAEDIIYVKTSSAFTKLGNYYSLSFTSCNTQAEINSEILRREIENRLADWKSKLPLLSSYSESDLKSEIKASLIDLERTQRLLEELRAALTNVCIANDIDISTLRSNISTSLTNILSSISAVESLSQAIASQAKTVEQAEDDLNLTLAGSSAEEIITGIANVNKAKAAIDSQTARLKQTEARLKSIYAKLRQNQIIAPFNGLVTKIIPTVGEIVSAGTPVVSLISQDAFQIETFIPEADIAKVKIGDSAQITLDAYTDQDIFTATVVHIDLSETEIDGISTYKTLLQFTAKDDRLKSGMTANIDITTDFKDHALSIPRRAILEIDGQAFVRLPDQDSFKETPVKTGLIDSNGYIEITEGLSENDTIITFIK